MKKWVIALDGENIEHLRGRGVARWHALRPEDVELNLSIYKLRWNHPLHGYAQIIDGLMFHGYSGDTLKRQACFLSHWHLWRRCVTDDTPTLVLESDALFLRDFDPDELDPWDFGIVSLNDPRGATRLAGHYHQCLQAHDPYEEPVAEAPWVDPDLTIPQGLPGMSAYVILPWFAKELLAKVDQVGAMPNDALCNQQWFPDSLGCLTTYATKVNGRPSTLA